MPITTSEDRIRRMKAAEAQAGPWTGDTPIDSQDIRAGVRGVADDTPQGMKMPAQIETDSYNVQGKPRLPRGGYNVWDEGAKEGEGFLRVESVFHPWLKSGSHPALIRGPHDLVHLQLEAHGQRVGDNALDQVQPRDGRLAGGHGFQDFVLLVRLQRRDP